MTKPKKSKPKIDYFDERRGHWTTFEVSDQWIIFRKSHPQTHWLFGLIVTVIASSLAWGMLQNPLGVITLLWVAYFVISTWRGTRIADRKKFPIVITKDLDAARSEFQHGRIFKRRDVRKFVVRENKNREGSDDRLAQIYMQPKDADYLVLIYQNYWTPKTEKQTEEIAQQFRDWIAGSDRQ